jgi:hypothetical protein
MSQTPDAGSGPLIYRIDATNRLTWVNAAWVGFARANGGEDVMPAKILGQDLLAAFADPTIRSLYDTMIRRARAGHPVRFDYRCDAPDRRRTFTMEIRPGPGGEVEFCSTLLREEPRPPVVLLQPGQPRDPERFVRVCSWCQKIALPDGRWVEVEHAIAEQRLLETERQPRQTHGLCEACHRQIAENLTRLERPDRSAE